MKPKILAPSRRHDTEHPEDYSRDKRREQDNEADVNKHPPQDEERRSPDLLPNPMPGVDPQRTPGIDR